MGSKKSDAYYRYKAEQSRNVFPYFESDEIEQIVYDLLDDFNMLEAIDVINQGLKQHPNNEDLVKLKVLLLIHTLHVDEAKKLFEPYINDGTESTETLKFAFDVVDGKDLSAIRRLAARLHRKEISSIDFVNNIDEMWKEISSFGKFRALQAATKYIDDNSEALARVGAMYMDLNEFDNAIVVLERSLDIDAYDIYTWQDLARCTFELKLIDKCEEACEFGIAIDPTNPLLHFVRGFILIAEKQNYDEAIKSLEICKKFFEGELVHEEIAIPPQEIQAQISMTYDLLAQCYARIDETDKAIECYEKLIKRMPDNHEVMFEYTQLLLDKGDLPKALETINAAIKIKKRNTSYLSLKASILSTMHHFDEALEILDKLIKIKPSSKNFVLAKAELALGIKKYDIADTEFRRLLSMKPTEKNTIVLMKEYFLSIGDYEAVKEIEKL